MYYRCRICGTYYKEWETPGTAWSPCCGAVLDQVDDDYIPDAE